MDGEINDQYRSEEGALKFLKNIIMLPGCGQFQEHASFVLRAPHSHELVGVVLTSAVAPGVGHTTQICVMPGYQRHGLGRRLIQATIQALRARRFSALSLTVTAANQRAVGLYASLGFAQIKTFTAGVWQTPAAASGAAYLRECSRSRPFNSVINSRTSLKSRYTEAKRTYATLSNFLKRFISNSPISLVFRSRSGAS